MTDSDPNKRGNSKAWVVLFTTIGTTYGMNWLSLHGVNFQVLGIQSELVKSFIEGSLLSFLAWLTPDHLIDAVVDLILWTRNAVGRIRNAFTAQLQQMRKP